VPNKELQNRGGGGRGGGQTKKPSIRALGQISALRVGREGGGGLGGLKRGG